MYISFGISPFTIGGAIIYQEALIERINAHGWETTCFFAAPRYTGIFRDKPYLKTWYKNKIKFIELYNSPYLFGVQNNPEQQCHHSHIEKLTMKILGKEKPDIVHFHELQMHPVSLIDIVSDRKIPSVKTIHNYYDICPQRDLMFKGEKICFNFDNGKLCAECLAILLVRTESFKGRIARLLLPSWLYKRSLAFYETIKKRKNEINRDKAQHIYKVTPHTPDQYCYRRHFFVERLNKLDTIHCSSYRAAEILIAHGVMREKIKVIPLSVDNTEKIFPKPLRDNRYPVIFGYIGGKHLSKGYQVLIDAFSMLDQTKAKLIIWGVDEPGILDQNLNIELRGRYMPEQINQIFQEIDVGVVPSIWEEIFGIIGIEFLSARIPVIGSKIGGIPEWLRDGENGFLVTPGDVEQLSQKMELFVKDPLLVAQIQRRIKLWKSFSEHINEMITFYENIITNRK